ITILLVLAWAIHAALGRGCVLVRSGLWSAVLLASIAVPALAPGLPRISLACLPTPEGTAAAAGSAGSTGDTELAGDSAHPVGPSAESAVRVSTERAAVTRPEARRPGAIESVIWPGTSTLIGLYAVGALVLSIRLVGSLAMVA